MIDLNTLPASSYTEDIGDMFVKVGENLNVEEVLKLFVTLKKQTKRGAKLSIEIGKADDYEACNHVEFVATTLEKFSNFLSFLYEQRDGVDWDLLEKEDFEIVLKYVEWSPEGLANILRRKETKIVHHSGEQFITPKIEEISCEEFKNSWANRLQLKIEDNLVSLLDDEIEVAEYYGHTGEEACFQVGIKLFQEKKDLEEYFGKSLHEIYDSISFKGRYDKKAYELIFKVAESLR